MKLANVKVAFLESIVRLSSTPNASSTSQILQFTNRARTAILALTTRSKDSNLATFSTLAKSMNLSIGSSASS